MFVDGGGDVSVQGSTFDGCTAAAENAADGQGGALFVATEGVALLSDETRFTSNSATGPGSTVLSEGISVYRLPAPPGHFILGTLCSVVRDPCTRDGKGFFDDEGCMATVEECSERFADNATICRADYGSVGGIDNCTRCRPIRANQPCPWAQRV